MVQVPKAWPSCTAFPSTFTGSWTGSRASRPWASACMRCQHCTWWLQNFVINQLIITYLELKENLSILNLLSHTPLSLFFFRNISCIFYNLFELQDQHCWGKIVHDFMLHWSKRFNAYQFCFLNLPIPKAYPATSRKRKTTEILKSWLNFLEITNPKEIKLYCFGNFPCGFEYEEMQT